MTCLASAAMGSALQAQAAAGGQPADGGAVRPDAAGPSTLERRVGVRLRNVPLIEALRRLQLEGVPLVYSADLIGGIGDVSCECANVSVGEALARLTAGSRVEFRELESGAVVLFRDEASASLSTILVHVEDAETGAPLVGASVRLLDTELNGASDADGRYLLAGVAPGEYRIEARLIGFEAAHRRVSVGSDERLTVAFPMRVSPVAIPRLDVTVSTGSLIAAEQRSVGHAITVIDAAEIRGSGARDLQSLLRTRVAGIAAARYGGTLGAGSEIRVRGAGSILQSGAPLVYVDGVAIDQGGNPLAQNSRGSFIESVSAAHRRLDEIPLEDIERIEVIRGPAATTLYGTGAVNGVIHIFTRAGVEGRPRFRVAAEHGVSTLRGTSSFLDDSPGRERIQRDLLRRGGDRRYTASLSGGGTGVTYSLDLLREDVTGVLAGNADTHTSLRLGSRIAPRDGVELKLSGTALQRSVETRAYSAMFRLADVLSTTWPYFRPTSWEHGIEEGSRGEIDVSRFYGAATLDFRASPLFSARVVAGGDTSHEVNDNIGYFNRDDGIRRDYYQLGHRRASVHALGSLAWPRDGALTSTVSFGVDGYHDRVSSLQVVARRLPHMEARSFSLGRTGGTVDAYSATLNAGAFVQQHLTLRERLSLTLGLRADGNSSFGENYGMRLNPKLASAYVVRLGEEWEAKLRAAWGQSSMAPEAFARQTVFRSVTSVFTDSVVQTFASAGNPDLRPEVVTEFEAGIDQYLFGDRASLELTYFRQHSRDAILRARPLPITGFGQGPLMNLGRLRSQGFELAAKATPLRSPSAQLGLGLSLTHMLENGVVTSLGGYTAVDGLNSTTWHPALHTLVGGSILDLGFRSTLVPLAAGPEAWRVVVGSRVPTTFGGGSFNLQLLDRIAVGGELSFGLGGFGWDNVQLTRDLYAGRVASTVAFDPEVARERYVFSTDHLRLDRLGLEYRLPERVLGSIAEHGRVWVEATNVHTLDRFGRGDVTTVNPWSSGSGEVQGVAGTLQYELPVPRALRFGVQLSF